MHSSEIRQAGNAPQIVQKNEKISPPAGLLPAMMALGAGGLFIGTGEFATMSLLPALASGTDVTVPSAGGYISAYAAGVVVGAPAIAVMASSWPRKFLLQLLLLLAIAGYGLSALSATFSTLLAARFIAGLPHGAWYGVAALTAASMVAPEKRATYVGYVMLGLAAANVAGVPLMTWVGQTMGWRTAFLFVAAGLVLTAGMVALFIPSFPADKNASPVRELSALRNGQVWLTLCVASVSFGGMFAVYSYITPSLTEVSGYAADDVPWILMLWGIGMIAGNIAGGWLADRSLIPAILWILLWNIFCLVLFSLTADHHFAVTLTLFLLGMGFALVPALQTRLMNVAGEAQTLAASLNHSAFNLANATGAALGGLSVASGYGWASTGFVGAALGLAGLLLMFLSVKISEEK